ncbi:MAG: hypothetical protein ACYCUD_00840 [Candidatus Dormibacteria bacterium]
MGAATLLYTAAQAIGMPRAALLGTAAAGLLLILAGLLLRWRFLVALGLFPLAGPLALVMAERGPVALAPALGAALLVGAELEFWSIDEAVSGPSSLRLRLGLTARTLVLGVLGVGLGLLVLGFSGLSASGALDLTLIGSVAVVGVLALALVLARSGLGTRPG